ncbi:hypothetical protein COCSUDRAFT_33917 [Coccomyxa subellipsoidea C-169]|uniref:Uncharacterized protein n=1 Tax=Coccomyxa subellipsoidea (strain C-169) TaxID=574566 RepID=I0YR47_COCSC|nr:hypothetical protein COCSUDRAFT_33917 [Coccomyxa subellipsoidea C-169]EIE20866.1 hypothetical protein COCSUDRAFT_33917 [Coccomyxa subellipsoidea C-169]|eukprot:XP_005645410.1 hypothetical protein COCSUDRAFT_33917 [Coccomyxa subellipsoidea C-169]
MIMFFSARSLTTGRVVGGCGIYNNYNTIFHCMLGQSRCFASVSYVRMHDECALVLGVAVGPSPSCPSTGLHCKISHQDVYAYGSPSLKGQCAMVFFLKVAAVCETVTKHKYIVAMLCKFFMRLGR